ncbi:MAG: hypothetical protein V2J07_07610 [Anaerolineae bacterium]|nr:hypothetical protein [Anaerolineae bacterium]
MRTWIGLILAVTVLLVILFAIFNRKNDHAVLSKQYYTFDPAVLMTDYLQSNTLTMTKVTTTDWSDVYELSKDPVATYIAMAGTLHTQETGESSQLWKLTDVQVEAVVEDGAVLLKEVIVVLEKNGQFDDRAGHYASTIKFNLRNGFLQWTNQWYARRIVLRDLFANGEFSPDAVIGIARENGGDAFCASSNTECKLQLQRKGSRWLVLYSIGTRELDLSIHPLTGKVRGN